MSTFQNISNGVLYVQGFLRQGDGTLGVGAQVYVESGETFTGSNYYKRFTYAGMIADGIDITRDKAITESDLPSKKTPKKKKKKKSPKKDEKTIKELFST